MLTALLQMERTCYADRQEEATLLKEREAFLDHLLQQGTSAAAALESKRSLLQVLGKLLH